MRLSWNEIRSRAAKFASDWKHAHYERGEAQTFYNEFFEVFGITRRRVATFEEPVKKLGDRRGRIDLFWKGVLIVEAKSAGGSLVKAKQQALDYFPGLKEHELPRYVLVSDFQNFELFDLEGENDPQHCTLATLPDYVQAFGFILGIQKVIFRDQDPVNIKASELMGELHDALEASGYVGHDLERFLVRLLFCLFADDASIFEPRGILYELLTQRTNEDGSDTGQWLSQLFEVLNTPEHERQKNLDEDLARFPYINGDLFQERLRIPQFDKPMRDALIEAANFKWEAVSPAIFGSLFQSVMNKEERRRQGAHYTTEKNILKVIQPLFLDELRGEFERLKARRDTGRAKAIEAFHDKLGALRFFDPACGCGNFLIIAYRELRALEIELLQELNPKGQRVLHIEALSKMDVDQFYGIEINEFPARIAEVALWMMDHIMNNRLSLSFGENYARIPLKSSPHIHYKDALEVGWASILAPQNCDFILGNPPFGGSKVQSELQRAQVRRIAGLGGSGGTLDYVAAWFIRAGEYLQSGRARLGFVATNSITQGEQVAQLWPLLFHRHQLEISFAHRTFAWGSDARGKAHVHVVIIGLTRRDTEPPTKRLFSYDDIEGDPTESQHKSLTAYLFDAGNLTDRHLVVRETTKALADIPKVIFGNMPNDDGNLILREEDRDVLLRNDPNIRDLIRPLIGARDLINGEKRFCLWLVDVAPERVRRNSLIVDRIERVRKYREASKRPTTRELAKTPSLFGEIRHTGQPYVIIPRHSSERREYVPLEFCNGNEIAHDSCLFAPGASLFDFGVLTSAAHMSWLRHIGGRIKSDYRYSVGLVLNTFPWPASTSGQRTEIEKLVQRVLDIRKEFPTLSLADLYDPDFMPLPLRKAHNDLDVAVDRLYRTKEFAGDRDRVEHLFSLYERLVAPLAAAARPSRSRRRSALGSIRGRLPTSPSRGARTETGDSRKPYYITTAIAYPNGAPHIGHAYELIATDAIARFMRLDGRDVFFLTGTDEHGIKMLQTAAKENLSPRELVERNVPAFQAMAKKFNASNDDFIRTTEARHYRSSEAIWQRMQDAGDIYLDKYSGWYSVRDEAYYDDSETRLDDKGQRVGPQGTPVEWVEEESYFFKLSVFADRLLDLYKRVPDFVLPRERMNEVARFVRGGLKDLSLSRTTFDWGIKVPENPQHIMYVWVDALTNYITAVGYPDTDSEKFKKYWPADLHVIGKDIVRFHAVYWPAFLMSAGIAVPRRIFSHGFLFNRGEKMSKSVGNVIDPFALADAYGVDPLRYFLLREVPFGQDGNYSHEAIVNRVNADLANDLGNLAQRSLTMVARNLGGVLPQPGAYSANDQAILGAADAMVGKAREAMATQQLHQVLHAVWAVVADANRYFAGEAPWALAKTDPARQGTVLYVTAEALRQIAILAQPFMPASAGKLLDLLAVPDSERTFAYLGGHHRIAAGAKLPAPAPVFPRYVEPEGPAAQ